MHRPHATPGRLYDSHSGVPHNSTASLYRRVKTYVKKFPRGKVRRGALLVAMELQTLLTDKQAAESIDRYEWRFFMISQQVKHAIREIAEITDLDIEPNDTVEWMQTGDRGVYLGPHENEQGTHLHWARVRFPGNNGSGEALLPTTGLRKVHSLVFEDGI